MKISKIPLSPLFLPLPPLLDFEKFQFSPNFVEFENLIDYIFSNFISPEIISGNITATISDHLPQFSFVPNILSNPSTQKSNYYERDWADLLQIDQQNVNLSMDSFLNNMNSILDVNVPLKKVNNYLCPSEINFY